MAELKHAVENNNIEEVKRLVENGANVHAEKDVALNIASAAGYTEIVRILLQAGADVHARKSDALIWACRQGHSEVVRLLLEAGADVHIRRDEPLLIASENGHPEIVRILLTAGADVHAGQDAPLRAGSAQGHSEIVEFLLEAGADIHANDDMALNFAVSSGHLETIEILLEAGANPNGWYNGILPNAMLTKKPEIVRVLLDAGAEITLKNIVQIETFQKSCPNDDIAVLLEDFKRNKAREQEKKEEKKEKKEEVKNSEKNPMVDKLCLTNNTLGGDELRDDDDFVVFLIQTEGKEERGECYLRSELQQFVDNAPDVSLWEGPPSGAGYKGPRHISGEKPIAYPGKKKEGITNRVYRLPWTGTWVTNAVIQRALFSGDLIIVLGGEKMAIGSIFGESNLHGQYGGHWGYLDGNPDEAVYFEDGDFEPDERMMVYDVVDSYR